jgi:DNA-binding GntR family transcriptional regulator
MRQAAGSPDAITARPAKLRDRAYESFTNRLLAREIRAGQFVSQRELVEITGLPLGAIRELIPRLEADGLIKTVPQRGMQVCHVDMQLVRNAFQFRLFMERQAAELFALNATDKQLARLRAAHENVLKRARKGVTPDLVAEAQAIDYGLHDEIIDALGNEIISNAYRVNAIKIRLIRQEHTRLEPDLLEPVIVEHLGIIEAFEARDPVRAAKLVAAHIDKSRNRALGIPPEKP